MHLPLWVFAVVGVVGAVAGLFGAIGIGGLIVVPAIVQLPGIDIQRAVAAALFSYIIVGIVGPLATYAQQQIRWPDAIWLSLGAVPGAAGGAIAFTRVPPRVTEIVLYVVVLCAGLFTLHDFRMQLKKQRKEREAKASRHSDDDVEQARDEQPKNGPALDRQPAADGQARASSAGEDAGMAEDSTNLGTETLKDVATSDVFSADGRGQRCGGEQHGEASNQGAAAQAPGKHTSHSSEDVRQELQEGTTQGDTEGSVSAAETPTGVLEQHDQHGAPAVTDSGIVKEGEGSPKPDDGKNESHGDSGGDQPGPETSEAQPSATETSEFDSWASSTGRGRLLRLGIGCVTGALSAITGTSGPVLLLPITLGLHWHVHVAMGSAQLIQLPIGLASTLIYALLQPDEQALEVGGVLAATSGAFVVIGTYLTKKIPVDKLKIVICVVSVVAAIALLARLGVSDPR